jgi:outer membrane murein-binding lipoprotein Lpp
MFRRRRPLLRAAVVGGGAYVAGKRVAQNSAQRSAQESDQDARIDDLEQQGGAQQDAAPPAAPPSTPISEQLKQLSALHEDGSLTDDEFAAAKSKLLGI